jgi:hypothetical protein
MRFRKLRIAWSVACGIACVLLIVLWVRSYRHEANSLSIGDSVSYYDRENRSFSAASWKGAFHFNLVYPRARLPWKPVRIGIQASEVRLPNHFAESGILGFGASTKELSSDIRVPCWFSVLLASMIAITPWIRWSKRFSLSTLLMATTLVAVVLGLIVWSMR